MRPYGAVDNNKDVCFHSAGSYTQSRDCHDDNLYFFSTLGEPGNQTLSVQTEITGRTTRTTTRTYRMIPFSEAGFSEFQNPPTSFSGEQVIFTSAVRSFFALWSTKFSAPPSHQHPTSTFAVQTNTGILWCLTATVHNIFGYYFTESNVSVCGGVEHMRLMSILTCCKMEQFNPIHFSACDPSHADQTWYVELLEGDDDGFFQIRPKLYEGKRELCLGQMADDDGDAARLLSCGTTSTKFTEVSSMIQHETGKCLYRDENNEALIKLCGSTSESYISAVPWQDSQSSRVFSLESDAITGVFPETGIQLAGKDIYSSFTLNEFNTPLTDRTWLKFKVAFSVCTPT